MCVYRYMVNIQIYMYVKHTFLSAVICCPLLEKEGKSIVTALGPVKQTRDGLPLLCGPTDCIREALNVCVCACTHACMRVHTFACVYVSVRER